MPRSPRLHCNPFPLPFTTILPTHLARSASANNHFRAIFSPQRGRVSSSMNRWRNGVMTGPRVIRNGTPGDHVNRNGKRKRKNRDADNHRLQPSSRECGLVQQLTRSSRFGKLGLTGFTSWRARSVSDWSPPVAHAHGSPRTAFPATPKHSPGDSRRRFAYSKV
jgi:hypothetical protein